MTYEYTNWQVRVDDRIAILTLDREAHKNTLTPDALHELRAITHQLQDDDAVWAVVVEGAGAHFSVGVDVSVIGQLQDQSPDAFKTHLRDLQNCLDSFESLTKPTIAKLRGFTIGGGMILALCCDFRIAAENTKISFPEVKRGIAVLMGTKRITQVTGLARAKELTLLGDMVTADVALDYGLLTRVVDNAALDDAVEAFAARFRALPPRTIGIAKQIAQASATVSLAENQRLEVDLQADLLDSSDFKEGIVSFFEKRPPKFTGR